MVWSQGLESWSGVRLPYWSGFLKWNPGGNVASGTGTTWFFFVFFFFIIIIFNTKKLSDMGVNFNHSHTMIIQII